jgi:hypothetical protein
MAPPSRCFCTHVPKQGPCSIILLGHNPKNQAHRWLLTCDPSGQLWHRSSVHLCSCMWLVVSKVNHLSADSTTLYTKGLEVHMQLHLLTKWSWYCGLMFVQAWCVEDATNMPPPILLFFWITTVSLPTSGGSNCITHQTVNTGQALTPKAGQWFSWVLVYYLEISFLHSRQDGQHRQYT